MTPGIAAAASAGQPLADSFDVGLLDLDGTVYVGTSAVPGAPAAVASARAAGLRIGFVTNNAARTPDEVAAQLTSLGITCAPDDVVTSAQVGARQLAALVRPGSGVLVVGGAGLWEAVRDEGMTPLDRADGAAGVVQGWAPDLSWSLLAEGAYALARGVPWVATNTDLTLPTGRGIAPGNGSFVALLQGVVGRSPGSVAGKPSAAMLLQAAERLSALRPLVVGDRLDTDIAGAVAAGMPSLLVLTGVSRPLDVVGAPEQQRPTFVSVDATGLLRPPRIAERRGGRWVCGQAWAEIEPSGLIASSIAADASAEPATVDELLVVAAAAWSVAGSGAAWQLPPGARDKLEAGVVDERE